MAAGRPKKYGKRTLKEAVERYFQSISRTIQPKDEDGEPIKNDCGEPVRIIQYVTPPSISALCLFLGIDRSTWQNYGEEFPEVIAFARARLEAYLEEQLLVREKGVQGIIFNLQNNYGWKQKQEVELGDKTRSAVAVSVSAKEKLALIAAAKAAQAEDFAGEGGEAG